MKPSIDSVFESHRGLILSRVYYWQARTGFDLDELLSDAYEAFVDAYQKWDPEQSKFSTFLYSSLDYYFKDKLTYASRFKRHHSEFIETCRTANVDETPATQAFLIDLVDGVSKDAGEMLNLLLNSISDRMSPTRVRSEVRADLRSRGWKLARLRRAWNEIVSHV